MQVVSPSSSDNHWVKIDVSHGEHSEMTTTSKEQVKILKGENVFIYANSRGLINRIFINL